MNRREFFEYLGRCPSKRWSIKNADCDHVTVCFTLIDEEDEELDDLFERVMVRLRRRQEATWERQRTGD